MKYSKAQVLYHWITVAVLFAMVMSGLAYSYDWIDGGSLGLHQLAGQALIVILVFRLIARLTRPVKKEAHGRSGIEDAIARIVHSGLYLCMIAYVVTGYVAASGLRDPMLVLAVDQGFARSDTGELFLEAHFALKWVLLALFGLHIAAVLKHRFWDKDTTGSNMTLNIRKP